MQELIKALQQISITPEDWPMDENTVKAHTILLSIPGTGNYSPNDNAERVRYLQNNFNSPELKSYVAKYPSLWEAFPNELSQYRSEALENRQITKAAPPAPIIRGSNMLPHVNVPSRAIPQSLRERDTPRIRSSGPLVDAAGSTAHPETSSKYAEYLKAYSGERYNEADEDNVLSADTEALKNVKLQEEMDRMAIRGRGSVMDEPGEGSSYAGQGSAMYEPGEIDHEREAQRGADELEAGAAMKQAPVVYGRGSFLDQSEGPTIPSMRGSETFESEELDDGSDTIPDLPTKYFKDSPKRRAEDAYELPETDSEKDWTGRDAYTIEKDVAITEALDAADYDKVIKIQEAYKNYQPLPTEDTDDWSYMGKAMHRYQEGGFVGYAQGDLVEGVDPASLPVENTALPEEEMGFVGSPEEAAADQVDAAQNGDMGGDNVDAEVPEGSFVLNSYAVELAGIKDIEKLVKDAKKFYMEQKQQEGLVSPDEGQEEDIEIRISEGEYVIPPALVRIIGRDRLEKINKRGIDEFERQQAEETEAGGQEMPQEPQGFMPQEMAAPMPPEGGAPMPPEGGAPMPPEQVPQGFAGGGTAQSDVSVPLFQTLNALQGVFGKSQQQKTAQASKQQKVAAVAQPRGRQNVARPKLPGQPPTAGTARPLSVGAPKYAALGGFVPRSADGSKKKYDIGGNIAPPIPRDKPPVPQDASFVSQDMPPVPQDKPVVQNISDEKFEKIKEVWLPSERAIISPLLAIISKGEGTSGASGYNIIYGYDKYKTDDMKNQLKNTPLSKMTLGQVQVFQKKLIDQTRGTLPPPTPKEHGTGAVGKYQINHTNIKNWLKNKKFNKNTIFSPEVQDEMATELIKESKLDDLVNNKISFKEFNSRLGNIWESVKNKTIKPEDIRQLIDNALRNFKKQEGGLVSQYQRGTDRRGVEELSDEELDRLLEKRSLSVPLGTLTEEEDDTPDTGFVGPPTRPKGISEKDKERQRHLLSAEQDINAPFKYESVSPSPSPPLSTLRSEQQQQRLSEHRTKIRQTPKIPLVEGTTLQLKNIKRPHRNVGYINGSPVSQERERKSAKIEAKNLLTGSLPLGAKIKAGGSLKVTEDKIKTAVEDNVNKQIKNQREAGVSVNIGLPKNYGNIILDYRNIKGGFEGLKRQSQQRGKLTYSLGQSKKTGQWTASLNFGREEKPSNFRLGYKFKFPKKEGGFVSV